ncbi:MAG: glycosyltransferase [Pseudomonadota bacterium]
MRLVVATALDEPWSVGARLVAYATYAKSLGVEVVFTTLAPDGVAGSFDLDAFSPTLDAPLFDLSELDPRVTDVVLFSAPRVHHTVQAQYGRRRPRFVHLVQSGLSASALGEVGYGYRLFHKPMTRVVVSKKVEENIRRLVGETPEMMRVDIGPNLAPFARTPTAQDPFDIVINAFDGDFTGRAVDLARQRGFEGRLKVVEGETDVEKRAAAYRSSAVLLSAPRFAEGIAQPAWEAMAAGCQVIMTNCEALGTLPEGTAPSHVVRQGDVEAMARALTALQATAPQERLEARRAGAKRMAALKTAGEADGAKAVLSKVFGLEGVVA